MEQTKRHIRIDFAPLDIAVTLTVLSSGSSVVQTYNAGTGEYEPNRGLTPTVIWPVVMLNTTDGSISEAYGNEQLTQMTWYVDGVDISTLSDWAGLYEIVTEGTYRGAIRIYRNLEPLDVHVLHFEGVIRDTRTGGSYDITTEGINLVTLEMSEGGTYTLCMDADTAIQYDPFKDRLLEYEYKVAHGIIDDTTAGRAAATDSNSYLRELPLTLYHGRTAYEGEYEIKVYEITGWKDNVIQLEEITITDDDDNEFDEISPDKLVMDLRLVSDKDYMVKAFVDGEEEAFIQFGVKRSLTQYTVMSVNGASRKATDTVRRDRCKVVSNGRLLEYPECVIRIVWMTDSAYLTGVEHNEGVETEYTIASTGAGDTTDDGWIDEYVQTEHKPVYDVATSEDDEVYEDEDGNTLIFN